MSLTTFALQHGVGNTEHTANGVIVTLCRYRPNVSRGSLASWNMMSSEVREIRVKYKVL